MPKNSQKHIPMNKKEPIPVIKMVKREAKKKRIRKADLARGLQMNPSSVQGMFKRSSMQIQKLVEISEVLEYNFFAEIAQMLPYDEPKAEENTLMTEKDNRIKELELEVIFLRKTLKELVGR